MSSARLNTTCCEDSPAASVHDSFLFSLGPGGDGDTQGVLVLAGPGDGQDEVVSFLHDVMAEADPHLRRHVVVRHLHGRRS